MQPSRLDNISLFNAGVGLTNLDYNMHQIAHNQMVDAQLFAIEQKLDRILKLLEEKENNDA